MKNFSLPSKQDGKKFKYRNLAFLNHEYNYCKIYLIVTYITKKNMIMLQNIIAK